MFKRIKRLLRKRNNAGFTLVEVIIASALLGVLMLGVFGFVQPVLSSVKAKEQNARALMLAEAVETYIASNIKYSYYVATFTGVTSEDVKSDGVALAPIASCKYTSRTDIPADDNTAFVKAAATLQDMQKVMDDLNKDNYEIRCIGMRWTTDPRTGQRKMMLTNEYVNQTTCALDTAKTKLVFETCFYDDLYPVLKLNNYTNSYTEVDEAGNVVFEYKPTEITIAPGLELMMDVYLDPTCYSTDESTRKEAAQTFTGTSYAHYNNIANIYTLNASGTYKNLPNVELRKYADALTEAALKDPNVVYSDAVYGDCYYPDTFIYYLVRKTKTTTTTTPPTTP